MVNPLFLLIPGGKDTSSEVRFSSCLSDEPYVIVDPYLHFISIFVGNSPILFVVVI